jgi:hypothetical protein
MSTAFSQGRTFVDPRRRTPKQERARVVAQTRSPLLIRETLRLKPNDDSRSSRANSGLSRRMEPKLKQRVSVAAALCGARPRIPEIRTNSVMFAIVAD